MIDRINIRELGPIKKADVDFKNLTIICGKNSVGKTYLSYSYYMLSKKVKKALAQQLSIPEALQKTFSRISNEPSVASTSLSLEISDFNLTKESLAKSMEDTDFTFDIFKSLSIEPTEKSHISCALESKILSKLYENHNELTVLGDVQLKITKSSNSNVVTVSIEKSKIEPASLEVDLEFIFRVFILDHLLKLNQFPITSERTGISLFYPDLDDVARRHVTQDNEEDDDSSRYCLPIEDNIDTVRRIRNGRHRYNNWLYKNKKSVQEQLSSLLGGEYQIDKGQVFFKPKGKEVLVPIRSSSGASKSLLLLDYFLHQHRSFGALVIDEPELNLHLDGQKEMARVLCAIANMGIQVVVTTHSDHLIREVNNLIMLSSDKIPEHVKRSIQKKSGIHTSSIIKPSDVSTVVINSSTSTTQAMNVSEYGIDLKLFNDEIMKSNDIANDLMMAIYDGE